MDNVEENDLGYAHVLHETCGCAAGYVSALAHVHTH